MYRRVPRESSATPGRWRTSTTPYLREMMDVCCDDNYQQVVFMLSSQLGKTEAEINLMLYHVAQDPASILVVMPNKGDCGKFSKTKLGPSIRETTEVSKLFDRSRTGNTVLTKNFAGGAITITGAHAASNLAGLSVRIVICDEVDRFPDDVEGEGDPIAIAANRSITFHNRKLLTLSTPTLTTSSKINKLYEESDQRKYHIRCIHCNELFEPKWEHVKWDKAEDDPHKHLPETAYIECPCCSGRHSNYERLVASSNGEWIKHNPDSKIAGFHSSILISPFASLEYSVTQFLSRCKTVGGLKSFYNTFLGLPFEDKSQNIDDIDFTERLEEYDAASIPNKVAFLTAGADVQADRLECSVWGWGEQDESWLIEHVVIRGDTTTPVVWQELSDYLKTRFRRSDGAWLNIDAACIDSGHNTQIVNEFTKRNKQRRWFSTKGHSIYNQPVVANAPSSQGHYMIGTDTAKEILFARLRYKDHGAGYVHFPDSECATPEYFSQLAAERKYLVTKGGKTFWKWDTKPGQDRNEALDCAVYAMAARKLIHISVAARLRRIKERLEQQPKEQPKQKEQEQQSEQHTETPEQQTINKEVEAPQRREIPKWKQQLLDRKKGGRRTGGGWL